MLRILSHGGGVQTTVAALMHARGELPPIDAAIFADTKEEPRAVYRQLAWVEQEVARSKYPFLIHRVSRGNLWAAASTVRTTRDGQRKYIATSMPLYFRGADGSEGIGRRQCTEEFKIRPIIAKARELLDRRRKHIPASDGVLVEMLMGFTVDEIYRVKQSPIPWISKRHELIDAGLSRADCYAWAERRGYPELVGSACKFCPNRTDRGALEPDELAETIERELILQDGYAQTAIRKVPYLSEARIPLSQLRHSAERRRKMAEQQMNLFINDCSGGCGV